VRSILRTLQIAHAQSIFHCDVRPANLVAELNTSTGALQRVLLIDWGLCASPTEDIAGRGVPAYAADAVVQQATCTVKAQLDLIAVAFTWLSIAFGDSLCNAPWVVSPAEPVIDTLSRRAMWILEHVTEAKPMKHLLDLASTRSAGGCIPLAIRCHFNEPSIFQRWDQEIELDRSMQRHVFAMLC